MARLGVIVLIAVAVAGIPSFMTGKETRFTPCPGHRDEACARIGGDGPRMRLQHAPGARPVGVPDRLAVAFGTAPEETSGLLGQAVLRLDAPTDTARALEALDRPAVVVGGWSGTGVLTAARAPGVDGLVLLDPTGEMRAAGPALPVSMLVVASQRPARSLTALSVRPLVLLRRPGDLNECVRRVLAGFARDPLSPRPDVTDCR